MPDHKKIIATVRCWVETVVIELNLCPFAKRELLRNRVRFAVTDAETETQLLSALEHELELLETTDSTETTLLIHPNVLQDFYAYNQFLDVADALLVELGLDGIYQLASFHPDYQFADTDPDDAENYTNRSPYPLLHLIREASLTRAIESYPGTDLIPDRNIALLKNMGHEKMQAILQACFQNNHKATLK